jgi:hypothetical protein
MFTTTAYFEINFYQSPYRFFWKETKKLTKDTATQDLYVFAWSYWRSINY